MREFLKRSRAVHSSYKLFRRLPEAPIREWAHHSRTAAIFRVLPNTMLSAPRLMNAYDIMETVERNRMSGAVAECGVWAGGAIGLMASVTKRHGNRDRLFHLFDSFEGLPQPSDHDTDVLDGFRLRHPGLSTDDGQTELVALGTCAAPLEVVNHLFFDVLGIDRRQVVIHKGWFQDTVHQDATGPLAVLRIDGDWYESTKTCLEGLFENVVSGGYIIIDDYGEFVGCAKAVDEFLAAQALSDVGLISIDASGVYFTKP